ncbi:MAG: cysteine--tRNA ligase [Candidatus Lightella neohaematopini]|nr:cysteine--tRNA ligase [Candidatus Lightella neohaematopini]
MLKIFNSLTRKKEYFTPLNNNIINIYICGVTAYDLCHIGHGRTFLLFDVIIRYLRYKGYLVKYARNITDIDDKIINTANNNNESIEELTSRMINFMHNDFKKLNIIKPNLEPRVTNHISEILNLIMCLVKKKHAYITKNGDVAFSVNSYKNYGALSNCNINNIYHENKVFSKNKNYPLDFILWKRINDHYINWISPWGKGRPGWHTECAAICNYLFGNNFDIHGGGIDLIFPHHENEIAQAVCAYGGIYSNIWMHTGIVKVNNSKMSKSLKNYCTIKDLLKLFDGEVIRLFVISSHYRSSINYELDNLLKSYKSLRKLYITLNYFHQSTFNNNNIDDQYTQLFFQAMDDDFNTPLALSILFNIAHKTNFLRTKHDNILAFKLANTLKKLANILGLLYHDTNDFLNQYKKNFSDLTKINLLIQQRNLARKQKKWDIADNIRKQLLLKGIRLEDNDNNTIWFTS